MSLQITKSYRSEADEQAYTTFRASWPHDKCPFCDHEQTIVAERPNFLILKNDYPYYAYDGEKVAEHLLVVSKRHIRSLGECNDAERKEFVDLIAEYEGREYNFVLRAPDSGRRSVAHHHGHFIRHEKQAMATSEDSML